MPRFQLAKKRCHVLVGTIFQSDVVAAVACTGAVCATADHIARSEPAQKRRICLAHRRIFPRRLVDLHLEGALRRIKIDADGVEVASDAPPGDKSLKIIGQILECTHEKAPP